jgi:hypothetical protein
VGWWAGGVIRIPVKLRLGIFAPKSNEGQPKTSFYLGRVLIHLLVQQLYTPIKSKRVENAFQKNGGFKGYRYLLWQTPLWVPIWLVILGHLTPFYLSKPDIQYIHAALLF